MSIQNVKPPPPCTRKAEDFLKEFGLCVEQEYASRLTYQPNRNESNVTRIVHIVGAPRSGTSFLYYGLAFTGHYAYFTSDSHHAWHAYHLRNPRKENMEEQGAEILRGDSKRVRLRHDLIFPSEAEHIWQRAISCYEQNDIHTYALHQEKAIDIELVRTSVADHCAAQERSIFLSKTPFNSLRMKSLNAAFVGKTRFIHIRRNAEHCAESIRRNGFFYSEGKANIMSPLLAREYFEDHLTAVHPRYVFRLTYEELMEDIGIWSRLADWIVNDE